MHMCLKSIAANVMDEIPKEDMEIIIADGGSKDDTLKMAKEFTSTIDLKTISMVKADIPYQLNRAASAAKGDILVFLHADCRLPSRALAGIKSTHEKIPGLAGGAFTMKVEGERFFYRILSVGGNFYCRSTKTFFGDRAIFVKKNIFYRLSGYRSLAIMSDFDLSRRMKKAGKVVLLKGPVISSGRKFEKEPFYRVIYLMLWSLASFKRGADLETIKEKYYVS